MEAWTSNDDWMETQSSPAACTICVQMLSPDTGQAAESVWSSDLMQETKPWASITFYDHFCLSTVVKTKLISVGVISLKVTVTLTQ